MSEFHIVDHAIPETREEYLQLWYKRLNEAAGKALRDALPGVTAFTVREDSDDRNGVRIYTFSFWFGEIRHNASITVSIDLLEDKVIAFIDPYIDIASRVIAAIQTERNRETPSNAEIRDTD